MSDGVPERAARAFDRHEAFAEHGDGYAVTTTRFDGVVGVAETDEWALRYTLTVRVPMLSTAVEGAVGDAVEAGWFETLERRLEDVTMATRAEVDLTTYAVEEHDGDAVAEFTFSYGNADRAPEVVKAMAEFVEGTYVEGIVPGYDYRDPVAELLARASQDDGEQGSSPTPL